MKDPANSDQVAAYLARLSSDIKKACAVYIGQQATAETNEVFRSIMLQAMSWSDLPVGDDGHLQFAEGDSPDKVVPANLYTAMRMLHGVNAPSWEECQGDEWTAPDGTVYFWKDGETYARLAQPLHQITFTIEAERRADEVS